VLTDVYAGIARFIEGWSASARPPHVPKWRVALRYLCFGSLSFVLGFHLVSYFVSPYELLASFFHGTVSGTQAGFLAAATLLAFFDFVVLRQTFCKYLCPYARLQGVLFDSDTLIVAYDQLRGEPRARGADRRASEARETPVGDCVDCGLCVAVCPTDIDIRHGMQLECIACTQCIDACNGVMSHVGKPSRLIAYRSLVGVERRRRVKLLRPRVFVYGTALATIVVVFGVLVVARRPLGFQVVHNTGALYGSASDGRASNAFVLRIENRDRKSHAYRIRLEAPAGFELVAGMNPVEVPAATAQEARVFVLHVPSSGGAGVGQLRFVLEQIDEPSNAVERTVRFLSLGASPNANASAGGASGAH
jgi:cytochrome c oxidase accessory protein FixG